MIAAPSAADQELLADFRGLLRGMARMEMTSSSRVQRHLVELDMHDTFRFAFSNPGALRLVASAHDIAGDVSAGDALAAHA